MTKDAALKLALEALEAGKPMFDAYWGGSQFDNAIAAIKEALAQPEQDSVAMADYLALLETHAALKAKLLEPRNFCSRCGKRTPDLATIHTCTPPRGLEMT